MIKVQSCLPAYQHGIALLARSLGLAADVSQHSCLLNVGTVLRAPSLQGPGYRALQKELPQATATDTVQGIRLIRWKGFAVHNTLERRLVFMEGLVESTSRFLGVLLIWVSFWWEHITSTASLLNPK